MHWLLGWHFSRNDTWRLSLVRTDRIVSATYEHLTFNYFVNRDKVNFCAGKFTNHIKFEPVQENLIESHANQNTLVDEVKSKFSIDSLPVQQVEVEFETSLNSFTNVDELTVVKVDVSKSFELFTLFEEHEIITCNNVINLDKETLENVTKVITLNRRLKLLIPRSKLSIVKLMLTLKTTF